MNRLALLAALSLPLAPSNAARVAGAHGPAAALAQEHPPSSPSAPATIAPTSVAWALALEPVRFAEVRTHGSETVRLYTPTGELDDSALDAIDRVAGAASGDPLPPPMSRRLLRLVIKAAAHFGANEVDIVSTYRETARPGSRHRMGEAMDFSLPGVTAAKLAQLLRSYARVGVGVYTNRRTQFVHLDVRDASYHWADASPPGKSWRESRMTDRGAKARDAAYTPDQDLPDAATSPTRDPR